MTRFTAQIAAFTIGAIVVAPCSQAQAMASHVRIHHIESFEYPRLANLAHVEGQIKLLAHVSARGAVTSVSEISGHPLLVQGATKGLMKWRFSSCDPNDNCDVEITITFILTGKCSQQLCPSDFIVDVPDARVEVRTRALPAIVN